MIWLLRHLKPDFKATWQPTPSNCSMAPAGFSPCSAPHSYAADDTGSGLCAGPVIAGSGNRAGSSGAVKRCPGRFAALGPRCAARSAR